MTDPEPVERAGERRPGADAMARQPDSGAFERQPEAGAVERRAEAGAVERRAEAGAVERQPDGNGSERGAEAGASVRLPEGRLPEGDALERLLAEGAAEPVEGWDFSWFEGRATEERPAWGYARLMGERMAGASVALDIQTGGGEVLAGIPQPPPTLLATESWGPNLAIAARKLRPLGGQVVQATDDGDLPFATDTFDLVVSRHPTVTVWPEIARVLRPGGTYLSQQVGAGSCVELVEAMIGPHDVGDSRSPARHAGLARSAGLDVVDLREQALRMTFYDIGAVVYFLRKVFWFVPDFTVAAYLPQLVHLHERIQADGSFVTFSSRFLIEARRPCS